VEGSLFDVPVLDRIIAASDAEGFRDDLHPRALRGTIDTPRSQPQICDTQMTRQAEITYQSAGPSG
jgi:hypothetical protein